MSADVPTLKRFRVCPQSATRSCSAPGILAHTSKDGGTDDGGDSRACGVPIRLQVRARVQAHACFVQAALMQWRSKDTVVRKPPRRQGSARRRARGRSAQRLRGPARKGTAVWCCLSSQGLQGRRLCRGHPSAAHRPVLDCPGHCVPTRARCSG